jgi:hypothetical protein
MHVLRVRVEWRRNMRTQYRTGMPAGRKPPRRLAVSLELLLAAVWAHARQDAIDANNASVGDRHESVLGAPYGNEGHLDPNPLFVLIPFHSTYPPQSSLAPTSFRRQTKRLPESHPLAFSSVGSGCQQR